MAYGFPVAPVVIFAFNRPSLLSRTLKSLGRCDDLQSHADRPIYVFVDGPRENKGDAERTNVAKVMAVLEDFGRAVAPHISIVRRNSNLGLRQNIMGGVSQVLARHGRCIVMEDDFLVGKYFLRYMDEALEVYKDNRKIWCVNSGRSRYVRVPRSYPSDVYLSLRNVCGAWGAWSDRWEAVDFAIADWPQSKKDPEVMARVESTGVDVKWMLDAQYSREINSWAVACTYHMAKNGLYAVEPTHALSKTIGFGAEGTHFKDDNPAVTRAKYYDFMPRIVSQLEPDDRIVSQIRYMVSCPRLRTRIWRRIMRLVWGLGPRNDEPVEI